MNELKQGGKRPGAGRPPKLPAEKVRQLTITVRAEVFDVLNSTEVRQAALDGVYTKFEEAKV